jgi:hypothetical protein
MADKSEDDPEGEALSAIALPHQTAAPVIGSQLLHCAVRGFEIPSFPAMEAEFKDLRKDLVRATLYRFQTYITELHDPTGRRALALQFTSDHSESVLGARVRAYILCRSAAADPQAALDDVRLFERQAQQTFPSDGVFAFGRPRTLRQSELEKALFHAPKTGQAPPPTIAELRKFEEVQDWAETKALHCVPHRLWADPQHDPWLSLIETLGALDARTAVRIELTPVELEGPGLEFVTFAGRWFDVLVEDLKRRADKGEEVRNDMIVTEEMTRSGELAGAMENAGHVAYVRRGAHVFERLNSFAHAAFCLRVVIASEARELPSSVVGAVRAALSSPPPEDGAGMLGWRRPDVISPSAGDQVMALHNLRHLAQTRWGPLSQNVAAREEDAEANAAPGEAPVRFDLRPVVTPEEAVALFHLPVYDRAGQTSAVSTVDNPFVIPPETLSAERRAKAGPSVPVGRLYQRETLVEQTFDVEIGDLMKPSLLVGAPGSGKTNLAFSLLLSLWRKQTPFLVLDPSTGNEFRKLLLWEELAEDLVVYTAGDNHGFPLRFNPFAVPPGVTARNHATRILAAFKSAYKLEDPFPAIYEAALERIYRDPRFCKKPDEAMDEIGRLDDAAPTLSDFAKAIQDEVKENVETLYAGSKESIGIFRGATTIRVNAVARKIGDMINVPGGNGEFIQNLLKRPVVIEMGALGDSSNIALVMAFLLSQLAGHIEFAFNERRRTKGKDEPDRTHVIVIEEAHRLLDAGGGEGAAAKAAEDLNTMLSEVRKFGQGILTMDQRPSSLVGGVLDNAYVKILTRLSDREAFERLSAELNLNEAQQRFARTRLMAGDAILLDRKAGQPVLVRAENLSETVKQELPDKVCFAAVKANTTREKRLPLVTPEAAPVTIAEAEAELGPEAWWGKQAEAGFTQLLEEWLKDGDLVKRTLAPLKGPKPDPAAAKRGLEQNTDPLRAEFTQFMGRMWERARWAIVGKVADTWGGADAQSDVRTAIRSYQDPAPAPISGAAPAPAPPAKADAAS